MKEKDLDKNLDNVIIDGLIKEAEQENADFAAAMRKMSDKDFDALITPHRVNPFKINPPKVCAEYNIDLETETATANISNPSLLVDDEWIDSPDVAEEKVKDSDNSLFKKFRIKKIAPWITAAVSAAAVILLVLIPSFNAMNAKLCDSALYMSEAYITAPKGGFDISTASIEQIKEELPNLERQYQTTIEIDGKFIHYHDGFQDAGWTLAIAYLKLHKKRDAVKVLKTLESQTQGTPFGDHCKKILEQLD